MHTGSKVQDRLKKMNRILKETGADLVLLPHALFRTRNTPFLFSLTLFKILYGAPMPITVLNNVFKPMLL